MTAQTHRCPLGHEWRVPDDAPPSAPGADGRCPVCGGSSALESTIHWPRVTETAAAANTPPALAGYEILGELGRGGSGVVYRARHVATDRVLAVKVIRKDRLAQPEVVERFRREAQAAARLSHANIVRVYESDQDGDVHFLAMELVAGETLQRLVEQAGPLPVAQACDYVRQAAVGLQHAAERALVHRDIKPANLMVVAGAGRAAPRGVVKILDMGVARLDETRRFQEDSLTTLTRDGAVVGTPDYIAPEQLENPRDADIRADLYSLGCTFYFLLRGEVPFPGGSLIQKLDRQRWETPLSLDQARRDVPAAVAAVVRRLMAKHPDDRFQTPGELAEALDSLRRTGQLPLAQQPTPLEQRALWTLPGPVTQLAVAPGGAHLVAAGPDRALRRIDAATGAEAGRVATPALDTTALAVHPATGHALAGQGAGVRLWDLAAGREVGRWAGHTDTVRGVAVTPDGRYAVTVADDRTARVWDVAAGREANRYGGGRVRFTCVAVSPDGRRFAAGGQDGVIRLWELHGPREPRLLQGPKGAALAVAFGPDGATLASGHFDTTVRLWDLETGREGRCFQGHRQMVGCVALPGDGSVVSAGHDGTVRVWDPASGAEISSGRGHARPVTGLVVAGDGPDVWTAGLDGTLRRWHLAG